MSDIVIADNVKLIESDVLNPTLSIDDRLQLAGHVADKFKNAIQKLGLINKIKDSDYVTVSGWSTLGTMLGIHVENITVEQFPVPRGFGYRAKVDLVDKNGVKIGEGDAIASSTGRQKEDHAVYSMAITRATGKAYRLCLAWLVEMAGYNPTPYEEMPESMINQSSRYTVNNATTTVNKVNTVNNSTTVNDGFVSAEEIGEPDPTETPVHVTCMRIKAMLEDEGVPVTKSSMRSKVVRLINEGKLPKSSRGELIMYIDRHCPEELES